MAYTKVSIPKNGDGAGCPSPKSSDIIIMDVEDIEAEPTRTLGDVAVTGDYTLKEGAKAVCIYGTPKTIAASEEYSGDADARGVKQGVEFEHPGNEKDIKNFIEAFMNKGVVILVKECDGSAAGRVQAFGNKCNPLFLSVERTDSSEANKRKLTWKQDIAGKFLPADYEGELPALADAATAAGEGA